jgi:hypothetical protein
MLVVPLAHATWAAHIEPQLKTGQTLLAQIPLPGQLPQWSVPPHPSPMSPQYWPPPDAVQALRTQVGPPVHRPLLWSQTHPAWKVEQVSPQSAVPPQPSPTLPQYLKLAAPSQTSFVQPGPPTQEFEAALHTHPAWRLAQLSPQSIPRPQPSPTLPQ